MARIAHAPIEHDYDPLKQILAERTALKTRVIIGLVAAGVFLHQATSQVGRRVRFLWSKPDQQIAWPHGQTKASQVSRIVPATYSSNLEAGMEPTAPGLAWLCGGAWLASELRSACQV